MLQRFPPAPVRYRPDDQSAPQESDHSQPVAHPEPSDRH
ncbi:Uncharacterised protein [Segatella copri]|nr:Uncharacterised protein [Segatella copri]